LSVSEPLRFPSAVGVNDGITVQLAPTASVVPQLLPWAKSPADRTGETDIANDPLLVSVIVDAALVVFSSCVPKFTLAGVISSGPKVCARATLAIRFGANVPATDPLNDAITFVPAEVCEVSNFRPRKRSAAPEPPVVGLPVVPARSTLITNTVN